jgi:hypothetical protein
VSDLQATLDDWQTKVVEAENDLHKLDQLLVEANERNLLVHNDLKFVKPYS